MNATRKTSYKSDNFRMNVRFIQAQFAFCGFLAFLFILSSLSLSLCPLLARSPGRSLCLFMTTMRPMRGWLNCEYFRLILFWAPNSHTHTTAHMQFKQQFISEILLLFKNHICRGQNHEEKE